MLQSQFATVCAQRLAQHTQRWCLINQTEDSGGPRDWGANGLWWGVAGRSSINVPKGTMTSSTKEFESATLN